MALTCAVSDEPAALGMVAVTTTLPAATEDTETCDGWTAVALAMSDATAPFSVAL